MDQNPICREANSHQDAGLGALYPQQGSVEWYRRGRRRKNPGPQAVGERPLSHWCVCVVLVRGGDQGFPERVWPPGVQESGPVPGVVGGWSRGHPECQSALEAAWKDLWSGAGQMAAGLPVLLLAYPHLEASVSSEMTQCFLVYRTKLGARVHGSGPPSR